MPEPDLTRPSLNLRDLTPARVSLPRTGVSLRTPEVLDFALAHAQARDAVYATLAIPSLLQSLHQRNRETILVHSAAPDRPTYIRRPDLGRTLTPESLARLHPADPTPEPRLTIILADGLSALATNRHAIDLFDALLPKLRPHFSLTPIILAEQARVALGDPIAAALQANITLMLIGERPGLTSPDSLGAYLTWNPVSSPRPHITDADRNCVSNIRSEGLDHATAANRIAFLCTQAAALQLTGTALKEAFQPLPPKEEPPTPPQSLPGPNPPTPAPTDPE
jgi:ethanolamine ammonia-lyase small subunit